MASSHTKQEKSPDLKGCTPTLIKNIWLVILILAGCILTPILAYFQSDANLYMPNSQAIFILLPMAVSFTLLPFTGVIRKIIYAAPLLTMFFAFWPLAFLGLIEKIKNPQLDLKKIGVISLMLWITDVIFGWFFVGIGALLLTITVITYFSK